MDFIKIKNNIFRISNIASVSKMDSFPVNKLDNGKVYTVYLPAMVIGIIDHNEYINITYDSKEELSKDFEKISEILKCK